MNVFVDTSVWSLALRRSSGGAHAEVEWLGQAIDGGQMILTTGLVLQELLQGFRGPRAHDRIVAKFSLLPCVVPDLDDHIAAAGLRNRCRRRGIQVGTIDALIAQVCIRHGLQLLSTDDDFERIALVSELMVIEV